MLSENKYLIDTVIIKVVAPCNLNCTYCYEYNMGDDSWKKKPKRISKGTLLIVRERIQKYINDNNLNSFAVTLHGGEPLMLSEIILEEYLSILSKINVKKLQIGIQTNATLANLNKIKILNKYNVNIGVSIDGNENANKFRVDLKGKQAHKRIVEGVELIKKHAKYFSGFLSVVNLNAEPDEVLDFLAKFNPAQIDFLQPFANYSNPPIILDTKYNYGDWMVKAFSHWNKKKNLSKIRIRYFEDALFSILNNESRSDWFGIKPPGYIIISTDGSYEGLDTIKVASEEARITNKNAENSDIDDVAASDILKIRKTGLSQLPDDCKKCKIKKWCSGGYFPTRYSQEKGYNNKSYYCADLKIFFNYLNNWIQAEHK